MKKLILLFACLLTLGIKSQITGYELNNSYKTYRFDGTQANYTNGMTYLAIDTTFGAEVSNGSGGYYIIYRNQQYYSPCWIVWDNSNYIVYTDSMAFFSNVSYNSDDRDLVWKDQKSSYSTTAINNSLYKSASYQPTLSLNSMDIF